jgi:heptosyltransferase-2
MSPKSTKSTVPEALQPKVDCIYFDGYKPCRPHKETQVHCNVCDKYQKNTFRILFIKTGAAGEVVRNTPLLRKIKELYPQAEIWWLTQFPDLVPKTWVHKILAYNWENVVFLQQQEFDLVLSLDKQGIEVAIAKSITAKEKRGFILNEQGRIIPANEAATGKWVSGVFDDVMRANTKHYVEELFEVCGWQFQNEKYVLDPIPKWEGILPEGKGKIIGLNTGAGPAWRTRVWPHENFAKLAVQLLKKGYRVLFLGGPEEDQLNQALAKETGGAYLGVVPYKKFLSLLNECDSIVTTVTFAMHAAVALEKNVILLNTIFPANEFYLYNKGVILDAGLKCQACYKAQFDDKCLAKNCMEMITPEQVMEQILAL